MTDISWTSGDTYSIEVSHARVFTAAANGSDAGSETQLGETPSTAGQPSYTDRYPAWDPTGSLIAFTSGRNGNDDIYTFTTAGATPTNLTDDGVTGIDTPAIRPSWSPDGQSVVFQTYKPSLTYESLWKVNRTGTTVTQLTTSTDDALSPAWSPDGTKIAYQNGTDGALYVMPAVAGGTAVALTTAGTPTGPHNTPDWQPALVGVNDTASVNEGGTVDVDVLANDNALGSTYGTVNTSATLVQSPTKGTATRDASDGSFIYHHTGGEIGTSAVTDSFVYTVTQGSFTSTATVTVTINPVNNAPTAVADEYLASHGATLNVSAADGLLANDTDPEHAGLSAVKKSEPAHGTVTVNPNGSFVYTNDGLSAGAVADTFTYAANDGTSDSNIATVTINVGPESTDPPSVTVSGPGFGAPGVEANFSLSVTNGSGPRVYDWSVTLSGSEVASGSSPTLTFTPAGSGVYTVSATVTDDAGLGTDTAEFRVMNDIASSVFTNDIVWLANEGITKGCNPPTNDQYCPNNNVTRGQMAAFLVRFLGLTSIDSAVAFHDISGSVFEDDILNLATAGITKGCNPSEGNTKYCPNDHGDPWPDGGVPGAGVGVDRCWRRQPVH